MDAAVAFQPSRALGYSGDQPVAALKRRLLTRSDRVRDVVLSPSSASPGHANILLASSRLRERVGIGALDSETRSIWCARMAMWRWRHQNHRRSPWTPISTRMGFAFRV